MEKKNSFALVKWVDGNDNGTYTVGINTQHIKQFEPQKYQDDPDRIWTIEWRDTKKEPLGGSVTYPGKVLRISTSLVILEKTLDAIGGLKSPQRIPGRPRNTSFDDSDDMSNETSPVKKTLKNSKHFDERNIDEGDKKNMKKIDDVSSNTEDDGESAKKDDAYSDLSIEDNNKKIISKKLSYDDEDFDSDKENLNNKPSKRTLDEDIETPKQSRENKENLKQSTKNFGISTNIEKNVEMEKTISKKNSKNGSNNKPTTSNDHIAKKPKSSLMKEIYPDTDVFIRRDAWLSALEKRTFKSMATTLADSVFTFEELKTSNVGGGISRVDKKQARKKKLDPVKLCAIKLAVQAKWESTFTVAQFNAAINTHCRQLK